MTRNRIGTLLLHFLIAAVAVVGYASQSPKNGHTQSTAPQTKPADAKPVQPDVASPAQSPAAKPQPATGTQQAEPSSKMDSPNQKSADLPFDRPPIARPAMRRDAPPKEAPPPASGDKADAVKLAVDLVQLDAQVLQQKTGRIAGNMNKESFTLMEDGVKQTITHFSQDTLPLSVILLIDRGGCMDPFSDSVHNATMAALSRLRPQDEVALMAFHNSVDLVAGFTRDKRRIFDALHRVPPHDEQANHCFNRAFDEAAAYMNHAANPDGRRVIIVLTGITTDFDCPGPSGEEARRAVLESGAVVCGIIPKTAEQRLESGIMRTVTGIGGVFKAKASNLNKLAEETGGEVLSDKPEMLNHVFNDLIDHLRTRYVIGFVSTNTKRDGTFRKIKLDVAQPSAKSEDRLVVRTRRGYIAAKARPGFADRPRTN
ncbi:MAG TPA: VWA domain-containing protein [Burkholderiales bacterium]|nr:VWA domain-containing protein [Burkholderiales bacterium]